MVVRTTHGARTDHLPEASSAPRLGPTRPNTTQPCPAWSAPSPPTRPPPSGPPGSYRPSRPVNWNRPPSWPSRPPTPPFHSLLEYWKTHAPADPAGSRERGAGTAAHDDARPGCLHWSRCRGECREAEAGGAPGSSRSSNAPCSTWRRLLIARSRRAVVVPTLVLDACAWSSLARSRACVSTPDNKVDSCASRSFAAPVRNRTACSRSCTFFWYRSTKTVTLARSTQGSYGRDTKSTAPAAYPRKMAWGPIPYELTKMIGVSRVRSRRLMCAAVS